ncbi:MAG: hypothetical protein J6Y18_02005 [Candidatus Methanomethylophilaceae archaeon]|nr:hypothetical protein [Candidatus Methanomethylophilaceae archaeon]
MKSTWMFILALAVVTAGTLGLADASSAEAEPPSFNEIISTIQPPDYSMDRFISDTQTMFSESMLRQMGSHASDLISFIADDTFIGDIPSGNAGEAFKGDTNYINYFVLACIIIALICVLGAFLSYMKNRKTYFKYRED